MNSPNTLIFVRCRVLYVYTQKLRVPVSGTLEEAKVAMHDESPLESCLLEEAHAHTKRREHAGSVHIGDVLECHAAFRDRDRPKRDSAPWR